MIEPVIDALTTPVRPLDNAIMAIINSAALPKVAFNNPPTPAPTRAASDSVARPIHPARGMMPRLEQMKTVVGLLPPGQNRSAIAIGTKITSQLSDGLKITTSG